MPIDRREVLHGLLGASVIGMSPVAYSRVASAQVNRASTMRVVWPYDTSSLDPTGIGVQRSTWGVSVHIYDRLVTYAVKGENADGTRTYDPTTLAPELAESWEFSDDHKTVTFHLRKDAKFHDGSPVTAEDVVWSITRAIQMPASSVTLKSAQITSADQLKAVDAHTFQVTLPQPSRYSVSIFTFPYAIIINSKLAAANATTQDPLASEWLRHNAAGSGAFKIQSFRSDQVVLTRNDEWANGEKPAMEQVIFQTVPEATTRVALVERGSADIAIEIPPADLEAVAQRGQALAIAIPMPNHMDFLAFNSQAAPFDDVRVRQAVAHALQHPQIFETIFRGKGIPLNGGTIGKASDRFPQPHGFDYDPEKAKALLAEAGHANGFDTSLAYSQSKAAFFDPLSLAIRDALGSVGIRVQIERLPGAQFDERNAARTLPMMLENRVAWLSTPDYWLRTFYTANTTSNLGNFHNAELEAKLGELRGDATPEDYSARVTDMLNLVLTEIPLLPFRQGAFELVMSPTLKGYTYAFHALPDARTVSRK